MAVLKNRLVQHCMAVCAGMMMACLTPAGTTLAQQGTGAYLDDRSGPHQVIQSYYNAVERHEYARAWSYWGDEGKPDQSYGDFVAGFTDTRNVDVVIGSVYGEAAAGSIYYGMSVAMVVWDKENSPNYFAGCFFLKQVQPGIQEPPFKPLYIYDATLNAVDRPHFADELGVCAP